MAQSVHKLRTGLRWFTVIAVPPLVALMAWAAVDGFRNNLDDEGRIGLGAVLLIVVLFGGMALVFIGALVWAFRARVVIDGDRMTVRGVFTTTVVTPDRMSGFRYVNGQLYLYLKGRKFGIQLYGFENFGVIDRWIQERTHDMAAAQLDEEDAAIAADTSLGFSESEREARLQTLRTTIRHANHLVYAAIAAALVNFLFIENELAELLAVGALVLVPVFLDLLALSNRGHVRIDYDEGSRYPQILTATLAAGAALALMSLLDRGALLDGTYYDWLVLLILAKGLLWVFIDRDRLKVMLNRGWLVTVLSVVGMILISAAWVGGSLYQANKLLDTSDTEWHETVVVETKISSGRTTSYSVKLAPWDPAQTEVVEYTLRRAEFSKFEEGMPVQVGVRQGAVGIAWASDLRAIPGSD